MTYAINAIHDYNSTVYCYRMSQTAHEQLMVASHILKYIAGAILMVQDISITIKGNWKVIQ